MGAYMYVCQHIHTHVHMLKYKHKKKHTHISQVVLWCVCVFARVYVCIKIIYIYFMACGNYRKWMRYGVVGSRRTRDVHTCGKHVIDTRNVDISICGTLYMHVYICNIWEYVESGVRGEVDA